MAAAFPPFEDRKRFPILTSQTEEEGLLAALMACDGLLALAPEEIGKADLIGRSAGREWHEYGDTRWPGKSVWVEFPVTNQPAFQAAAALIVRREVPELENAPLDWIASNHPMASILPAFAAEKFIAQLCAMLAQQANSDEAIPGPEDLKPAYVQSYCLYGKPLDGGDPWQVAIYTDILNRSGIPIARFRTAEVRAQNVPWCRFALNALFHLNGARLEGFQFVAHRQFGEFSPRKIAEDWVPAKWTAFHPTRTLRLRPAVRALPAPAIIDGLIDADAFRTIVDTRRREANSELLAFDREVRPRDLAMQSLDSNATIGAFLHRANGASIYVLPGRLVDEFDKTDCTEVRLADLHLPFPNLYLKFTPQEPIALDEGAVVDGCYAVKQGSEILLQLTSRISGVDYENSFALTCIDPIFAIHLPAEDPEMTVNQAVEQGIDEFLKANAPPEDDLSTTVERLDGLTTQLVDIRAKSRKRRIERFRSQETAFRACLNIIVNALCFIVSRPEDLEETWEGAPPADLLARSTTPAESRSARDKKSAALRRIENGDFTRIKLCGRKLFEESPASMNNGSANNSPRAHWRRGHWRRQRHGPSLTLVVLRWIRPTLVKKEAGAPAEVRIYDVSGSDPHHHQYRL